MHSNLLNHFLSLLCFFYHIESFICNALKKQVGFLPGERLQIAGNVRVYPYAADLPTSNF